GRGVGVADPSGSVRPGAPPPAPEGSTWLSVTGPEAPSSRPAVPEPSAGAPPPGSPTPPYRVSGSLSERSLAPSTSPRSHAGASSRDSPPDSGEAPDSPFP